MLADEINRATPKTQSALLEAMQERTVTSGTTTHELEAPFLVMATQNPIEMEGTYPLPEAQLDRFLMKILVTYPTREELAASSTRTIQKEETQVSAVLDRDDILEVRRVCREVLVAPHVQDYADRAGDGHPAGAGRGARLWRRSTSATAARRAARRRWSNAGACCALMRGRFHLTVDDIQAVAAAVLRHRIILNFDAHCRRPDAGNHARRHHPQRGAVHAGAKV